MENLVALVGALKQRIEEHGRALRESEALTRYALVDPLLRLLGWNTEDPAQVAPEFKIPSEQTRADYALFAGAGHPAVIVEAKKLGTALDKAARQALQYCMLDGFKFFVVTDGNEWRLYETLKEGNLNDKRITGFDVRSDATADVCRRALALWRQGFVDNAAPAEAPRPQPARASEPEPQGEPEPSRFDFGKASEASEDGWMPLTGFVPGKGEKPPELRMPTGETETATTWVQFAAKVAEWLHVNGKLSARNVPIRLGRRYVLSHDAKHPSGKNFHNPTPIAGGLVMEGSYSAADHVRNARAIAEHCSVDPATFKVRT